MHRSGQITRLGPGLVKIGDLSHVECQKKLRVRGQYVTCRSQGGAQKRI